MFILAALSDRPNFGRGSILVPALWTRPNFGLGPTLDLAPFGPRPRTHFLDPAHLGPGGRRLDPWVHIWVLGPTNGPKFWLEWVGSLLAPFRAMHEMVAKR